MAADEVFEALESLRHNHDLLLKDKRSLESCFEQESLEKDRLESILKTQTTSLRALLRTIRLQNRDSVDTLSGLCQQLARLGYNELIPASAIIGLTPGRYSNLSLFS